MYCENCGKKLIDGKCPNCNNKKTNVYAIVGFILSFFISIAGLIFSIVGLKKSKELNEGKGLSIAGIIISIFILIIKIFLIFLICMSMLFYFNSSKIIRDLSVEDTSKLYEITDNYNEFPTITNNVFRYEKFYVDDDIFNVGAYNIVNLTETGRGVAIHIKFYDDNKNYLTEFDTSKCSKYNNLGPDDLLYLEPNEGKNVFLAMYEVDDEGCGIDKLKFDEAEYYSIEDIEN